MFRPIAALLLCAWLLPVVPQSSIPPLVPPPRFPTTSEELHAAIRAGNLDETKRLIDSGVDVNARDSFGNTPLLYAAWSGNAAITACLLTHGAEVNAPQAGAPVLGRSALEAAVLAGRTDVVRLLLSAGGNVNVLGSEDRTLLHLAARYGFPQIADLLLSGHAKVNAVDSTGHTPLDEAALFAQTAVVPVLLRQGADLRRVRPQDGRNALHEACIRGSAALIGMLVSQGADPAERDKSGQTPLDLALAYQNRAAIAALERLALGRQDWQDVAANAMRTATLRGETEIARLLIDGGFDVRKPKPGGTTYLHEAALKGQTKIVRLFLDRGADVNSLDETGGTPLHSAALAGSSDVIALLLDRGARIDAADREAGATPLMLAASVSRTDAVALLLRRGANPMLRDHAGHTALDRARQTEDPQTVKLLETAVRLATSTPKNVA